MSKYNFPDRNILDTIYREMKDMLRRIRKLEQIKNPTMPEYDPTNVPDEFPDGGFFIGTNDAFYVKRGSTIIRIGP